MMRVDLWDFYDSRVYSEYRTFRVEGERDGYRLTVGNYTGELIYHIHIQERILG